MNVVLQYVKQKVDERYHPDGYNVGINVNEAAGQSVFHVHMHLIPRYKGDVPNPKGGVRGVIPSKQSYDANEGFSSPAQSERKKAYALEEKRNEHGNAYIPWEEEADQLLCRLYDEGNSISVLAEMFERTKGYPQPFEEVGEDWLKALSWNVYGVLRISRCLCGFIFVVKLLFF